MRKLIHGYLSNCFIVTKNSIIRIDDNSIITSGIMVSELIPIFGLTKKQLKWYIKSWVRKKSKSFNFNEWWANKFIAFISPPFIKIKTLT